MSNDSPLSERLADPSRPVFLLGDVPPGEGTSPGKCQDIANKFLARSRPLATDGFIVYDIQDEPGRTDMDRPFPFRRVMDSSGHAALLSRSSGKECLVYKCVADANFDEWLRTAVEAHGHGAINLVGRASSEGTYEGPTISEAMERTARADGVDFGCVCIAERHTLESAAARGKSYPTEHTNMVRKIRAGAKWFISQAVYDPEHTIRLLKDYSAACKQEGIAPRKVVLTFAPVSRKKTMNFIKWLGVKVPPEAEEEILGAERPVDKSIDFLCDVLRRILAETAGVNVPLGVSCESVSIFKSEIDGVHELFRRLQCILLDSRGSPWKVSWIEVMPPAQRRQSSGGRVTKKVEGASKEDGGDGPSTVATREILERQRELVKAGGSLALLGVLIGAAGVSVGVMLGAGAKRR